MIAGLREHWNPEQPPAAAGTALTQDCAPWPPLRLLVPGHLHGSARTSRWVSYKYVLPGDTEQPVLLRDKTVFQGVLALESLSSGQSLPRAQG